MGVGLDQNQLDDVRLQMKELIEDNPVSVSVTRYRMDTGTPPASWDEDYGEVADHSQIQYDQVVLKAQVYYEISEKTLYGVLGGDTEVSCELHFVHDADVCGQDYLEIGEKKLMVFKVIPHDSYLQVFCKNWAKPQ